MRALALVLAALSALAAGALAAQRAAEVTAPSPALSVDAGRPLFTLSGLRHGSRAERCVTVTNEGPGAALAAVLGRGEGGDLAPHLRAVVTRGCGAGTILFSGSLTDLAAARDPEPWPAGERRGYGIAIEVAGADDAVQGRRAVHEFAFAAEPADAPRSAPAQAPLSAPAEAPLSAPTPAREAVTEESREAPCTRLRFSRDRRRLIKHHRVDARVTARLILRIYGLTGQQRLVLVTGLRVGRKVLPGRRFGSVAYRVGAGAAVTSKRRPFRVRIAPGALKPGRNVVRVTVVPRGGRPVEARYVLTIAGAVGGCEIG